MQAVLRGVLQVRAELTSAHPASFPISPPGPQVLFSGLGGELAASLQRRLTQQGVASERILVCDL